VFRADTASIAMVMSHRRGFVVTLLAGLIAGCAMAQTNLPAPTFHHLHLNSTDPDAAIAFYEQQFTSTAKTSWHGMPALASPNGVLVVFTQVDTPAASDPEATALWHFGWHVTDSRRSLARYEAAPGVTLAPLYTGDGDGIVFISSDTYPGTNGSLGLTQAQIAQARVRGVQPRGGGGFAYLYGPDNALVEYVGNMPAERFNHVHMYQEDPFCAQVWYQQHLNAPLTDNALPRTQADCGTSGRPEKTWPALLSDGMYRTPQSGVLFGDVSVRWYVSQIDTPLQATRGRLMDHIALGVGDLDAWITKLRGENVRFLEAQYVLGDTRAIMIEGPSREAIELVEVK
jgi:catechol 2,3-dioxygenase-like lactoylglutathione lyase family enzyme